MNNFKSASYSISEVAQIIGVTPITVRTWINKGKFKAHVEEATEHSKYRKYRIYREDLVIFLKEHKNSYNKEILDAFGIDDISEESKESPRTPTPEVIKKAESHDQVPSNTSDRYALIIDGRISIANIPKEKAVTIFNTLMYGADCEIKDIQIKAMDRICYCGSKKEELV